MDTEIVIVIVIVAVIVAVETSGLLKMFSFFLSIQTTDLTATLREYIGLDLKVLLLLRFTIARPKRRVPTEHDENVQHVVIAHKCCKLLNFVFILATSSSRPPHGNRSILDVIGHRNNDDGVVVLLCLPYATCDRCHYFEEIRARAVFWCAIDAHDA